MIQVLQQHENEASFSIKGIAFRDEQRKESPAVSGSRVTSYPKMLVREIVLELSDTRIEIHFSMKLPCEISHYQFRGVAV